MGVNLVKRDEKGLGGFAKTGLLHTTLFTLFTERRIQDGLLCLVCQSLSVCPAFCGIMVLFLT